MPLIAALACQPAVNQPAQQPARTAIAIGETCTPDGKSPPEILDENLQPIDLTNELSIEAAVGHRVVLCAPVRRELRGRVVDENDQPVAGATVIVESWQTPPPIGGLEQRRRLLRTTKTETMASGAWHVPAESAWMLGILAADGFPFFVSSYCVLAVGFAPFVFDPWQHPHANAGSSVGDIVLRESEPRNIPALGAETSSCGIALEPSL
ncbi:MAG TPA: carboxypeptidase-like regulatory domain-containing protein [Polyangiaceae bacterium]|nr:carboxypeptidase-like regulatory domain-containing protein [Polyangiaceae bacterium]